MDIGKGRLLKQTNHLSHVLVVSHYWRTPWIYSLYLKLIVSLWLRYFLRINLFKPNQWSRIHLIFCCEIWYIGYVSKRKGDNPQKGKWGYQFEPERVYKKWIISVQYMRMFSGIVRNFLQWGQLRNNYLLVLTEVPHFLILNITCMLKMILL